MISSLPLYAGIRKLKEYNSVEEIDANILSGLQFDSEMLRQKGIYIFGVGKLGQKIQKFLVHNGIPVLGFVDNNKSLHGKNQNDIKVFDPSILTSDSIVYIASETYLNPIQKQLKALGVSGMLSHFQGSIFFKAYKDFPVDVYLQNLTEDLIDNKEKYVETFGLMKDEASKIVFDNLILYRLTGDLGHIDKIATASELEYFDETVIRLGSSEVFFDCGGFDGDSAQNFLNFCGNKFKSIHIFEPDKKLLEKAKAKLAQHQNIFYNELGIFNQTTTLTFDTTGGWDGAISAHGNSTIKTIALDEYETGIVPTYIKLDIEGVEIEALAGAQNTIKRNRPKLAIASYHFPRHLWEVPLSVLKLNPEYDLFIRHYTNYLLGSTCYFLPAGPTS